MKVKVIIIDELPSRCEDCIFGHKPLTEDDEPCDLVNMTTTNVQSCPLVLEEDYSTLKDYC